MRAFHIAGIFLAFSAPLLWGNSDSFAGATDLGAVNLPYYAFVPSGGTAEAGEPSHDGSAAAESRWFRWQAPTTAPARFQEFLNGTNSRIAIYTGSSVNALTLVAQGRSSVFFPATAGTIYRIAIDSPGSDVIGFQTYPAGGADDVAAADPLPTALPQQVHGNNIFATPAPTDEDWHPEYHPEASVWWSWTADFSGSVHVDARRSDFEPRLSIYERQAGDQLVRVGAGFSSAVFDVAAGKEYVLGFDTTEYGPGRVEYWIEQVPSTPPPNDALENAADLGNAMIACDGGWIFKATAQATAPNENIGFPHLFIPGDYTMWWRWACPTSGFYRFSCHGSTRNPQMLVYAGTPVAGNLAGSSTDQADGVRLSATAGTTYWIQLKDPTRGGARVELNIHPAATEAFYFRRLAELGMFRLRGAQRHPAADPDADGFPNEIEMACGTNLETSDASSPSLPRLAQDPNGWILQWVEDTSYTQPQGGLALTLRGETSTTLEGAWTRPTVFQGATSSDRFVRLPAGPRGFARVELVNPNWTP